FLGTGPSDLVVWDIEAQRDGCRVTVTDGEENRAPAMVQELTEGWTDFLTRLHAYCATGQPTRYGWRKEFDGAIELPIDAARAADALLSPDGRRRWMPWSADAIAPGATVTMVDKQQPAELVIGTVERTEPLSFRFTLGSPAWRAATECKVKI